MGPIVLILAAVLLGTAGELLLKSGIDSVGELNASSTSAVLNTIWTVMTAPRIFIGFVCYGLAAVLWLIVLSQLDLSYAYPMLALTYVLVPITAHLFLGEEIPNGRWAGIAIVVLGVLVVAYHQPKH